MKLKYGKNKKRIIIILLNNFKIKFIFIKESFLIFIIKLFFKFILYNF